MCLNDNFFAINLLVKQLSGYPKKQLPLTIVSEGRIISGNNLAEEINTAFVHVTQHLEPIHNVPVDVHNGDVILMFHLNL